MKAKNKSRPLKKKSAKQLEKNVLVMSAIADILSFLLSMLSLYLSQR